MNQLTKAKRMLRLFGIFKIPLIGFVRPRIIELTDQKLVVRIKLRRKTRNHLGSMYFGALAIGADIAGAFQAFQIADELKRKLSIVFKDFKADFIQRPESDVCFVSEAGDQIRAMVEESIKTGERVTQGIRIKALTGYPENPEVAAEFTLGLSIKDKTK